MILWEFKRWTEKCSSAYTRCCSCVRFLRFLVLLLLLLLFVGREMFFFLFLFLFQMVSSTRCFISRCVDIQEWTLFIQLLLNKKWLFGVHVYIICAAHVWPGFCPNWAGYTVGPLRFVIYDILIGVFDEFYNFENSLLLSLDCLCMTYVVIWHSFFDWW